MLKNIDYRDVSNRRSAFIAWCVWSLEKKDVDPALWLLNYLFERYEHNLEQKYWIAWIYGTTYHLPTAWVIWNEFPDYELVDVKRLQDWTNEHYKKLRYQTDTKYNKGYLPQQFSSYKKWINHRNPDQTQHARFSHLKQLPFESVFSSIQKNLYKFGRYSTWYYMQTLKECVGFQKLPNDLKLSDYSGSRSHRNGLCYALGHDDWIDAKLHESALQYLENESKIIKEEIGHDMDFYQMETLLCSFKKIFRKRQGRYLGYYLDRQAEEIKKVEGDGWHGVDWQVFWDARRESLDPSLYKSNQIRQELFSIFLETGTFDYGTV